MRFILETITGRKGIKNFSSLEEYVDFMTKNGDKIKNIVESDLPYDDKPVNVATPSQSNGWEQVNKATFGNVIKKAEKGDCILPHKATSVFKDEAKFEPSKFSEKKDSQEEDVPQFKYDEPKSEEPKEEKVEAPKSEEPKSEEKDDTKKEKKQVNEGFENIKVGDKLYDDKNQEYVVDEIDTNYGKDKRGHPANYITLSHIVNGKKVGGGLGMPSTGLHYIFHTKEQVDEGRRWNKFKDNVHNIKVKAKQELGLGMNDEVLESYGVGYLADVFLAATKHITPDDAGFQDTANKIIKTDSKMKNLHNKVMKFLQDKTYTEKFTSSMMEGITRRFLTQLGIDENIINQAYEDYKEEINNGNYEKNSYNNEIAETLRIAGVQLNEDEEKYSHDENEAFFEVQDIWEQSGGSYWNHNLKAVCNDIAKDYNVDAEKLFKRVMDYYNKLLNRKDPSRELDYMEVSDYLDKVNKESEERLRKREENGDVDEDVNNPEDGEIDKKTGKEKLMEEDPFAALNANNEKYKNNEHFEYNVGDKFRNNENGQIYKITFVSVDKETGDSDYVLRNEETYEDEYVNGYELQSNYELC